MTNVEILAVVATLAGFLMALSPTLQIRRMLHTRSSRDVSLLYLSLLDLGFVAWISYGWALGNWALILSNAASLSCMTVTIVIALAFRRGRGASPLTEQPALVAEREEPSLPPTP